MTDPAEKYPLWCVDTGSDTERDGRYIGPFKTLDEARKDRGGKCKVRRCRRLKVSELDHTSALDIDTIVDSLSDCPDPDLSDAWANWDAPVVNTKRPKRNEPDAQRALLEWADAHLETKIYICEGDE